MLVIDKFRQVRAEAEAGSDAWKAALDRAVELVTPVWGEKELVWDGPLLAHGGVALALAIYIVAREQDLPVEEVTREQVESLYGPWVDRVPVWEARLRALQVDLDDEHDPLVAEWRTLIVDENPGGLDEWMWEAGARSGPLLGEAFGFILAPRWNFTF